jgi:hypothetical protein
MPALIRPPSSGQAGVSRPLVACLFVASVLLSVVSWYTTQQGMALYLSPWFSFLASLGVQSALVLVAWLVGVTESRRGLLIAVYAVTATVSIAFSYVALHTWFAARERPATIERRLYDDLCAAAGKSREILTAAVGEAQKHVLALQEMTEAEKAHGYVSRAADQDPYLARVREAVAREAASYAASYPEGQGPGLRYTAFDRHARIAQQTLARLQDSQRALAELSASLKPLDPTEQQLRAFHQVYDAIPWTDVRDTLHTEVKLPAAPIYSAFVDRAATGQEDLIIAFTELLSVPTTRHVVAFTLAAFIDLIVFLLAYASGPFFFGAPEERWVRAGAALDAADEQVFARDLLRKVGPSREGLARVEAAVLSPGERQLVLLLAARGLAAPVEEDGGRFYLLDASVHRSLVESLAERRLPLRASAAQPANG